MRKKAFVCGIRHYRRIAVVVFGLGFMVQSTVCAQGLAAWANNKRIIMNTSSTGANIAGDVKGFPVPVILTSANFDFSQAKTNGEDIRFTDASGNSLPYQIESWDAVGKKAAIWVRSDVKANDNTQYLVMYWGNASAAGESDGKKVFTLEDGWVGVWHMSEAGNIVAGGYKDATPNQADATGFNFTATNTADGRIGKCPEFKYASKRYLTVDAPKKSLFDLTSKMTFSIWVKATSYPTEYITMFAKGDDSWRVQMYGIYSWGDNNNKYITEMCVENGGGDDCLEHRKAGVELKPNEWNLLTIVHDNPKVTYYVNTVDTTATKSGTWTSNPQWPVGIGCQTQGSPNRFYDGYLDEARVLNVPKDKNWVKLNYESQREGGKFLEFGTATGIGAFATRGVSQLRGKFNSVNRYDVRGCVIKGITPMGVYVERLVGPLGQSITRTCTKIP